MAEVKQDGLFVPLPETKRGYGTKITSNAKTGKIIYAVGTQVVIRDAKNPASAQYFSEHKFKVNVAKFSPNGEWVASADETGKVLVWGVKNQAVKNTVQAMQCVNDLDWDSEGKRIVAGGTGQTPVRCFTWDSGNNLGEFSGHAKQVLSVAYKQVRPFQIASCGEDFIVNVHKGPPFKFESSHKHHENFANCVGFTPDGAYLISVGSDKRITRMTVTNEGIKDVKDFESKGGHAGGVYNFCFSPDGKQILTVSGDKTAKLWDIESLSCTKTFTFGKDVDDMQVGCTWVGDEIITVSLSGVLNYLDLNNPDKPRFVVYGHQGVLTALDVDNANGLIYSGDNMGRVCKWEQKTGTATWLEGKGHAGKSITGISVLPGGVVATTGADDKLRYNDAKSNKFSDNAAAVGGMPTCIGAAGKSDLSVVGVAQGKLAVVRKGAIASTLDVKYRPSCIAVSADESHIAVGGDDKAVHVYKLGGDKLSGEVVLGDPITHPIVSVAWNPEGSQLIATDQDRYMYVWDVAAKKVLNEMGWRFHAGKPTCVSWNPNGNSIATGGLDQNVIIWHDLKSFDSGARTTVQLAHFLGVLQLRWTGENSFVTAGEDRTIKLWGVAPK